jgi:hypothetical protein
LANIATAQLSSPITNDFRWQTAAPVVNFRDVAGISCYSIKDPTIVRYDGKWHLFCTIRGKERSHGMVYLSFADWKDADRAERHVLTNHEGYFCAPQVFYFSPQKKWYLICQAASDAWEPNYQAVYATSDDIADPQGWSKFTPLYEKKPDNIPGWIDFWVICDESHAHLFYTSNNGQMWRSETALHKFPHGWSKPGLALRGDIFEASHTYKLKGSRPAKYLTLIEAQGGHGWRYYKAYTADKLAGPWEELAASKDHAFASMKNVAPTGERWTDSISHGELLRAGHDERLEIDPAKLQFLFQGVLDKNRAGKSYGEIPWRLGILTSREVKQP